MTEKNEIKIEGFAPPEQAGGYLHLPFEVPPDTVRLDISYRYDSQIGAEQGLSGGNTVDIGLFDQRGVGFNSAGFRGWSGSDLTGFFVATDDSTPGYLPGPIEPGTWYVILGLYKMAPTGCNYSVTICFQRDSENAKAGQATFPAFLVMDNTPHPPVPPRPDGWYRGELHCHTIHSDGDSSPADVIAVAEALGLDFLAITDHNNVTHLADEARLQPGTRLILIPGFEVTTYKGHWNVWGGQGWVDFRIQTSDELARSVQQAIRQGYLTSLNHPRPYGPPWEFEGIYGNEVVEVWNGPWQLLNDSALAFWEARLRAGERIPAVGGSDMHRMKNTEIVRLATPTTWIYCPGEPSGAGLLAGLRAGHAFISERPEGPQLYLRSGDVMMGDVVDRPASGQLPVQVRVVNGRGLSMELHGADGCLVNCIPDSEDQTFDIPVGVAGTPYVRAQLVYHGERIIHALTNPIYLR